MRFPFPPAWPALLLAVTGAALAGFTPPSKERRTTAAGSLLSLKMDLRRAFSDHGEFEAKKEPRGLDWLAAHKEPGQTFGKYLSSRPNIPNHSRGKLYILPIGDFPRDIAPDLEKLKTGTAAHFHPMPVVMLPAVPGGDVPAKKRTNAFSGKTQWKSTDILAWLPKKLPADAFAMIAVTMTDLYPEEGWNFVFGQASIRERVGVFSFARSHPAWDGGAADAAAETLMLRRTTKILTHEMGHMFGIRHCIFYECNLNGANHLEEADATPMHLCPVCLRKLHHAIRFDPAERYQALHDFYAANGLEPEAAWVEKRLEALRAAR